MSSLEETVPVLHASGSADQQTRNAAESQFKTWSTSEPRFNQALLEVVALGPQAPLQVRIQAALQFKNSLDRWRKTCPKFVESSASSVKLHSNIC